MTTKNDSTPKQTTSQTDNDSSPARAESSAKKLRKQGNACLMPLPGFTGNPLCKLPRNSPCPCRSGRKFKTCCLSTLIPAVRIEDAKKYQEQIDRGSLVFVTKENEAEMRTALEMRSYFEQKDK